MITGKQFRDMIISGANNIDNYKDEVDKLNVFPVPDGDTGVNMSMTIGYAVGELERLSNDARIEQVASVTAAALLRGARGNSGVILSLFFRGFARGMQGKETADSQCFLESLKLGVEAAYNAMMKPTEGTILTVARVSVEKTMPNAASLDVPELLENLIKSQYEVLAETPEMLPVLKKAGVVDAGGKGLIIIFEGMLSALRNKPVLKTGEPGDSAGTLGIGVYTEGIADDMTDEYCTEFLVIKSIQADVVKLRQTLESIGNSVLCVDDTDLIKCHVHTQTPDKAMKEALKHGYLSSIKIENMLEQYIRLKAEAEENGTPSNIDENVEKFEYAAVEDEEFGFVAVSVGEGLNALFKDIGVNRTVEGGQSMNPSTEDILAAVQSVPAKNIFVFVNNKNIIMAAEQAANLADRNVKVIPTRSIPQGISAMLAFDPSISIDQNVIVMNEVADAVKSGSVTFAVRDSDFDGKTIKEGETLALLGGKLLFTDSSAEKAAVKLARRMIDKDTNYVTIIYGNGVSDEEAQSVYEQIQSKTKNIEVSLVNGGQPIYSYYISAE